MRFITLIIAITLFPLTINAKNKKELSFKEIETGFLQIPEDTQIAVYWYWISDNLSEEGIIRDLEAMKKVGINRAFIGNIGLDDVKYGKVKLFSEEWWKILHTALKKASELNIEIGIFNSPGWSQSGGPWIKPNESMRYVGSSQLKVKGPQNLQTSLPSVAEDAEDIRVLAFPQPAENVYHKRWTIQKREGKEESLDIKVPDNVTLRSITIASPSLLRTTADLYVKEGADYRLLKRIGVDRVNTGLNVGFPPYAPVVTALPETKGTDFRLFVHASGNADMIVDLSSQPIIERYPEKTLAKMFQYPLPMWHEYMWDKQPEVSDSNMLIDPKQVIDITPYFKNGQLNWQVPAGEWTIMRTAMCPTRVTNSPASPEGRGLEVDKMSKKHVAKHFDAHMGEILRRIPPEDRTTFKIVLQDSYETGGQNWTDDMLAAFKKKYKYDPIPYLPSLQGIVIGSPDMSDRFLWDLRRLVADRIAYDYVGGLREVGHRHGLTTWLENYGHWGFPGEFLQYGGQSDEIGGEFWSEGSLGDIENRAASSCAHIYGKRKVWAESFTAGGSNFSRYPHTLKQRGDRFFTEGINSTMLHVYIHQPWEDKVPGVSTSFGNEFNRHNTWFSQLDVFNQYLKRCNFMLQQGTYVADVAYFIGEDTPKMTGVCDPELPRGYSFDYINAEVLLTKSSVKGNKLTLESGMQYRVLVLPKQKSMRPELLKQIKKFVKEGLVVLGPAPEYSPSLVNYPTADREVQKMASELWAHSSYGKGKVFSEKYSLADVFAAVALSPDCKISDGAPISFIHRTTDEGDIYFLSNQSNDFTSFKATFRVSGKQPELWNPLTNEIRILPEYTEANSSITIPLQLESCESTFIIFRNAEEKTVTGKNYPQPYVLTTIHTPWKVKFEERRQGPKESVVFNTLTDWITSEDPRIKYYSGTADYTNTFTIKEIPSQPTYINLGKVVAMAKVYLNGKYVGGAWTYPYRLNITDYLQKGENTVKIEVVNNWVNRLIGDLKLPAEQRSTWTMVNPWRDDSQLQSSGLFGPVRIESHDYELLKFSPLSDN